MQPAVADTYCKHRNMVELYIGKPHISRDLWNYIETGRQERQSLKGKHKGKQERSYKSSSCLLLLYHTVRHLVLQKCINVA